MKRRLNRIREQNKRRRVKRRESRERVQKLRARERGLVQAIHDHRDLRKEASEEEKETHSDKIEALRARLRHVRSELKDELTRIPRLTKAIKKGRKRATHLRNKIALRKDYASPHFRWDEFATSGCPVPVESRPAIVHLCENYLEPLRKEVGPLTITSGYRPEDDAPCKPGYNSDIGGAKFSQHLYRATPKGIATDLIAHNATPARVHAFLALLNPGGLGNYNTFTHVDDREREGQPRARWSG